MSYRKKLIEVSLPLNKINAAASTEKSIRHGHPSTLHLWWARRPLATCRAVLFASLIDDPSEDTERFPTEEAQNAERERLFRLIERMVEWKNIHDENLIREIQAEIQKATNGNPPPVLDPFAGGGSIPLEAQRLGLEAHASDLNPVAVLINKALIEIPPRFANRPPVNPASNEQLIKKHDNDWKGAHGLADDIRYYGKWMRDEAEKRIGHLYPKAKLPDGSEATVIAWLWTRTVKCPNPACGIQMPLLSSFVLSSKKGNETYLNPLVVDDKVEFTIGNKPPKGYSNPNKGLKRGMSGIFECVACGTVTTRDYVSKEAMAKRLQVIPTATVAQGQRKRVYLPTQAASSALDLSKIDFSGLDVELAPNPRDVWCRNFGLMTPVDLFSPRQITTLTTFSDLVQDVRQRVFADAVEAGLPSDDQPLNAGGCGSLAYADAVATYLALVVDRSVDRSSTICSWDSSPKMEAIRNTFARQAIPMVWDFAEGNPFSESSGNWMNNIEWVSMVIDRAVSTVCGYANQQDATAAINNPIPSLISTDPPYYDNIGYADLSDFFYVWLRRSLTDIYPDLFRTMLVPKKEELVATPHRFEGSRKKAQEFFETGLGHAFGQMRAVQHLNYPLTVYYAFKQSENEVDNDEQDEKDENGKGKAVVASTGWETMLEGLIRAGFEITGTWPMRTEMMTRQVAMGTNALASSIVLVCRPRPVDAPLATRREFLQALRKELPEALRKLQHGSIAPVDLAQASIGPGMSIYSRYSQVVESDGSPLRVRTALQMINQELDAALREQEGEYDNETRWAIAWFEQYGMQEGEYGVAETLSKAKNMNVARLEHAGLVESKAGRVRLRARQELPTEWKPLNSTVWEITQRIIHELLDGKGEVGAGHILRPVIAQSESVRDLVYRLYAICERKNWATEALAYNGLITSWTEITSLAVAQGATIEQGRLL